MLRASKSFFYLKDFKKICIDELKKILSQRRWVKILDCNPHGILTHFHRYSRKMTVQMCLFIRIAITILNVSLLEYIFSHYSKNVTNKNALQVGFFLDRRFQNIAESVVFERVWIADKRLFTRYTKKISITAWIKNPFRKKRVSIILLL